MTMRMHLSSSAACDEGSIFRIERQVDKQAAAQVEFYAEEVVSELVRCRSLPAAFLDDLKGNKLGQMTWHYPASSSDGPPRTLFVCLGKKAELEPKHLRKVAQRTREALQSKKLPTATIRVPSESMSFKASSLQTSNFQTEGRPIQLRDWVNTLVGGFSNQSYQFQKYLTKEESKQTPLSKVTLHVENVGSDADLERLKNDAKRLGVIAKARAWARDMANERGEVANPEWYEKRAFLLATQYPDQLVVETFLAPQLREMGLNLMHVVGKGSQVEPRMTLVHYNGNPDSDEKVALVGKGITFDTGGLNLKPTNHIETMYIDNAGAATVLATLQACAELKIKKNVVVALCLAENAIGQNAVLPSAIIKSYKGLTVEIGNTDAEGRLVLADALSYVQKHYKPTHLIDVATLTGACIVALGNCAAGIFTNSPAFSQQLQQIGQAIGENVWPLPIFEEHTEELKGVDSDLRNIGKSRYGGACVAAAFLKEFIEADTKWCHLDVAGPAMAHGDKQHGASGFGVQLLIEWLERSSTATSNNN